MLVW
jgi:hypothetical protein